MPTSHPQVMPKPIWIVASLLAAGVLLAVARSSDSSPPLAALLDPDPDLFLDVTFLFQPTDCQLSLEMIKELNELLNWEHARVRAVMLGPILSMADRDDLLGRLGMNIPVTEDREEEWMRALDAESIPNPVLIVHSRGNRYVIANPNGIRMMNRYLPETMSTLGFR